MTAAWSLTDSTRFVGLAQNGVPQPGLLPYQDTSTGLFGAFDLKVAGNELPEGAGLIIRFPNGAQPVEVNGQISLRARDIDVLFGPDSFLQFARGDNGVHHIHSATDLEVPAGPVDMRLLERLLSRPVSNGVEEPPGVQNFSVRPARMPPVRSSSWRSVMPSGASYCPGLFT